LGWCFLCCNALQCIAVCCSVLQCAAACYGVVWCSLGWCFLCCSVLQCIAVWCRVLQCAAACYGVVWCSLGWCFLCCNVLQCIECVAVCCSVLQRVMVSCGVVWGGVFFRGVSRHKPPVGLNFLKGVATSTPLRDISNGNNVGGVPAPAPPSIYTLTSPPPTCELSIPLAPVLLVEFAVLRSKRGGETEGGGCKRARQGEPVRSVLQCVAALQCVVRRRGEPPARSHWI